MIYFIAGMQNREFKYLEILENIRKKDSLVEHFYDADIKEEYEQFLEKSSINSVFSFQHDLIVLKRSEKVKKMEDLLTKIVDVNLINKDIVIDYEQIDGKISTKLLKLLDELTKQKLIEKYLFQSSDDIYLIEFIKKEILVNDYIANEVIKRIGTNPIIVKNEINKLKIYFGSDPFDLKIAEKVMTINNDYKHYEITGQIFSNQISEVFKYLEKTKDYLPILYMVYSELEIILKLSNIMKNGYNLSNSYDVFKLEFEEIKEIFSVGNRIPHPYTIFQKKKLLNKFTNKSLKKLVYEFCKIENDIKIGNIEMPSGVELLLLKVVSSMDKR